MLCNIKNILIIVKKGEKKNFQAALGDSTDLGINLEFKEQIKPTGIPEAFIIGEKFINRNSVALILGDNFFYGQGLTEILKKNFTLKSGARIFTYPINDPHNFGIVEKTNRGKKARIVERIRKKQPDLASLYIDENEEVLEEEYLQEDKENSEELENQENVSDESAKDEQKEEGSSPEISDAETKDDTPEESKE